jgi:hypothetical protein
MVDRRCVGHVIRQSIANDESSHRLDRHSTDASSTNVEFTRLSSSVGEAACATRPAHKDGDRARVRDAPYDSTRIELCDLRREISSLTTVTNEQRAHLIRNVRLNITSY